MQKEMKNWSKLTIISILQFISLIAVAIYAPFFSASLATYGWEYVIYNIGMPLEQEALRIGFLFVITILAFATFYSIYLNIRLYKTNKFLIYTVGAFNWCLIPYYLIICKKNNYFMEYKGYLNLNNKEPNQISHSNFMKVLTGKQKVNKLFWNTILCYLTLISTIIGMGIIIATYFTDNGPKANSVMFHFFVWFTLLSNEILFIFMVFYIFLSKKNFYRENNLITYMAGYMFVVALVYWAYLFPQEKTLGEGLNAIKSVWLHAVNPLFMIIFCITSYFTNYASPKKSWHKFALMGTSLPLMYAFYAYLFPFVAHFSVYNSLTNLNPEMLNDEGKQMGGPIWIIGILVLAVIFVTSFSLLWLANYYIVKNHNKKHNLTLPTIKW